MTATIRFHNTKREAEVVILGCSFTGHHCGGTMFSLEGVLGDDAFGEFMKFMDDSREFVHHMEYGDPEGWV